MRLRPILFSTPMVQALIAGTKTQTRRKVKSPTGLFQVNSATHKPDAPWYYGNKSIDVLNEHEEPVKHLLAPYEVGDVLWVRETLYYDDHTPCWGYQAGNDEVDCDYTGILAREDKVCIPSIHMPFAACRLFLEVTAIRVERLQDISEEDSKAEGVHWYYLDDPSQTDYKNYLHKGDDDWGFVTAKGSYLSLWDLINGEGAADANPYVWVYEFKKVDKPAEV